MNFRKGSSKVKAQLIKVQNTEIEIRLATISKQSKLKQKNIRYRNFYFRSSKSKDCLSFK